VTHPRQHAGRPLRWAGMPAVVAVPLSAYAVRFHTPHPEERHRARCGVRATPVESRELVWHAELAPCGVCWPDVEPSLSSWDRLVRQCRYWDALGAWEGQGATTGRGSGQDTGDTGRSTR
jgi:hypothetical protein